MASWPLTVAISFVVTMSLSGLLEAFRPSYASYSVENRIASCPLDRSMAGFDINKFLGEWYVLEYEYTKEMRVKDLSCVGFHFSLTEYQDIVANFTFRFPPTTGFFYHVPTFSTVSPIDTAVWETQFKNVELVSVILDTDYSRWAVLAQCSRSGGGEPSFLSTRVMSRTRTIGNADWNRVRAAIRDANAAAPHKYAVEQGVCQEVDDQ